MLQALADGERDPTALAALADSRLRATPNQLRNAFGACADLHPVYRRLVKLTLEELRVIEDHLAQLDQQMAELLGHYHDAVHRLAEVPGLGVDSAQQIIAEVGASAATFPSYATTKHALEALAGSMKAELAPFGVQVQVINPGGYLTGFNETEAESSSHWMDDRENYIKRDVVKNFFDQILSPADNRMDPQLMADAMVSIIPEDTGLFRNVVPKATEELARKIQSELWDAKIDLPSSR